MAGFLYFLSGDTRAMTVDRARKLGLGYAFPAGLTTRETTHNSPSKTAGVVFADPKRVDDVGYFADRQTWRKLPTVEGRPELWVGYFNDAKPGPEDLRRANGLPGEVAMTLGDGNRWLIPTLTEFDAETKTGPCELPAPLDFDDEGNLFTSKPVGEYGELWDAIHPVALSVCFGSDDADSPIKNASTKDIREAAFRLLRANYVVDMPELVVLGCLRNDATLSSIVMASCRGRWLIEALSDQKKIEEPSAASTSDTTAGAAA